MLQVGRDGDLGQESLDAKYCAELSLEDLECDRTLVTHVTREIDRCHAALPDLAVDDITIGKGGPKLFEGVHDDVMVPVSRQDVENRSGSPAIEYPVLDRFRHVR